MNIKTTISKIGTLKSVDEIDKEMNRIINSNPNKDDSYFYIYQTNGDLLSAVFAILVISVIEALRTAKGSARDKVKCCDKLLRKCDRTIKKLEKQDTPEAKQELKKYNEARKKIIKEREYHSKRCVDLGWYTSRHQESGNMILNTYSNSNITANTLFVASGTNTSNYMYSAMYEEYIQNKIDNERRLANHIKQYIPVTESAYKQISAIYEAKIADSAKAKWNKFIEFIKNMFAKFAEKITHLLVDEKKYLEKYKKIILEKTPKEGNEFSIPGDYKVAIDRCINVTVPVFNYATYKDELKEEDSDSRLVTKIMHNHEGFQYDNGSSLAELFKEYFLAHDKGIRSGTFNDGYLNFTDMYNFCYNTNKIKEITTKDENYLNQSTNAIINAINEEIRKNAANNNTGTDTNSQQAVQHNSYVMFTEADGDPKPDNGGSDQNTDSKDSLKSDIGPAKNSNAISQMDTYENRSGYDDEKKQNVQDAAGNETEESMNKMLDKWLRVCRAIISAKLTAVQQISSDYMKIIRLHVQSYVGNDKDNADNKSKQAATDYGKGKNNGKNTNTGDNKQAANVQQNGGNNQQNDTNN